MPSTSNQTKTSFLDNRYFRNAWNWLITIITIYQAVYIPYHLTLGVMKALQVTIPGLVLTLIFSFDIYLDYIEKDQQHNPLHQSGNPRPFYLQSWFIFDLLAAIPFSFFTHAYFHLFRLAKIAKASRILDKWRLRNLNYANQLSLLYLMVSMLFIAHWISCGWLVIREDDIGSEPIMRYLDAFYWSMTTITTVGYGDILPVTVIEKAYAIFTMLIGLGFYGFLIGNIANILSKKDPAREHYLENIELLSVVVKYRSLPIELQKRIYEYYTYKWQKRLGFDETNFLEGLPNHLKMQVALSLKKDILASIPLFQHASQAFIEAVALHLKPMVLTPGDCLFKAGEIGKEMYFIINGTINVVTKDQKTNLSVLSDGDFFGEIALFLHKPRTATVVAETYCDLYVLSKDAFDEVITQYPYFSATIEEIAREREKRM